MRRVRFWPDQQGPLSDLVVRADPDPKRTSAPIGITSAIRHGWIIISLAFAASACASAEADVMYPRGSSVFDGAFGSPVFWDFQASTHWATNPSLSVA